MMKNIGIRILKAITFVTIPIWGVALAVVWIITGRQHLTKVMNWITGDEE